MGIVEVVTLVGVVLGKLAPVVADLIAQAFARGDTAEELRKKDIVVSIAFKGGSGEAIEVQRKIEADLA